VHSCSADLCVSYGHHPPFLGRPFSFHRRPPFAASSLHARDTSANAPVVASSGYTVYGLENPHPTHLKAVALALDFAQLDLESAGKGRTASGATSCSFASLPFFLASDSASSSYQRTLLPVRPGELSARGCSSPSFPHTSCSCLFLPPPSCPPTSRPRPPFAPSYLHDRVSLHACVFLLAIVHHVVTALFLSTPSSSIRTSSSLYARATAANAHVIASNGCTRTDGRTHTNAP
jgi:hypothetical protein